MGHGPLSDSVTSNFNLLNTFLYFQVNSISHSAGITFVVRASLTKQLLETSLVLFVFSID